MCIVPKNCLFCFLMDHLTHWLSIMQKNNLVSTQLYPLYRQGKGWWSIFITCFSFFVLYPFSFFLSLFCFQLCYVFWWTSKTTATITTTIAIKIRQRGEENTRQGHFGSQHTKETGHQGPILVVQNDHSLSLPLNKILLADR